MENTISFYGRKQTTNALFHKIVNLVLLGFQDGTIPLKKSIQNSNQQARYASVIVHYWLKHDVRLNGSNHKTRSIKLKKKYLIESRFAQNKKIKVLKDIKNHFTDSFKKEKVQNVINNELFLMILEVYEIDLDSIPDTVLKELDMLNRKKDKAA